MMPCRKYIRNYDAVHANTHVEDTQNYFRTRSANIATSGGCVHVN